MFNSEFKNIAKGLGLEDIGKVTSGDKTCGECETELRLGKDGRGYTVRYCPNCRRIIATVKPHLEPSPLVEPDDY